MFRRIPSRRAVAAFAKLRGYRLERRWPYLIRAEGKALNLNFRDLLEYQYARTRRFTFLSVGAYDGVENDPISAFALSHDCRGLLIEPQPGPYARLRANYRAFPNLVALNAAIDEVSGSRTLYFIPAGKPGLPAWTEQLASFQLEHLLKHEASAPGLSAHVESREVEAISFGDLIDAHHLSAIDVLQIDAEGMDAQLLRWFPFERMKPGLVHYEISHMSSPELMATRERLASFGYRVGNADSESDDMAVLA